MRGSVIDKNSGDQSMVCIYRRTADTWSYETTLAPLDIGYCKGFGDAIAISGSTVAVRTSNSESVYVFVRE